MNEILDDTSKKNEPDNNVAVVVPCKPSEFGNFLSNLLSKPQSLIGEKEGVFEIDNKAISNVYHLVDQRVKTQNKGTLANFEIKITYDNGTSVSHKSVGEFEKYYPTEPGIPNEAVLSFIYLVEFNGREAPEKQEIEIVFTTKPNRTIENRKKWYSSGVIQWSILHTERTWASDMNGLLKNHAKHCVDDNSGIWHFISKNYEEVTNYLATLIIVLFSIFWLLNTFEFLKENKDVGINILAHYYTFSAVCLFLLYAFLGTVVRLVTIHLIIQKESFICLVDKDFENKTQRKNKSKKRLVFYALSFVLNITAGIIASIAYNSGFALGL